MRYTCEHPRKAIGKSVHKDIKTKKAEEEKRAALENATREQIRRQTDIRCMTPLEQGTECRCLTPLERNFVETKYVKDIKNRVKLWLSAGYPVHIIGPTGCGKTTLAVHIANELGRPVMWINGDEEISTSNLIGGYSEYEMESYRDRYVHNVFRTKDTFKPAWVDNPLTTACKNGYTLIYNEFSRAKPETNNVLLSVFEEGILELPTKFGEERYIRVHPDFTAILTSNSVEYAGVHRAQDALLDRMVGIYMDFYDFDTEVEIVKAHTGISADVAKKIVTAIGRLRDKLEDAQKPGIRSSIMVARGIQTLNGNSHDTTNIERMFLDVLTSKTQGPREISEKHKMVTEITKELFSQKQKPN